MTPDYAVGIDVGTTFTAAAICRGDRTEVVTLGDRGDVIPSVAYLREDGELLVGEAAERRAVADATRVARTFKRRVGDRVPLFLGDQPRTAEALTAAIVRSVVDLVTAREGGPPRDIVLTLPASWRDHRRDLLLGAVADAGVEGATLLAEPVAVAVHYAARHPLAPGTTVGIYDLGGGTFDATIVRRTEDGFEIVGEPQGDDRLGGIDLDSLVWDHVAGVVGADALDPGGDPSPTHLRAIAQIRAAAVDAKEALSYDTQAVVPITLSGLMTDVRLTRREFEEMARPALGRTVDVLQRTCEAAGVAPADLHAVLLAGGSSRIPLISQLLINRLGTDVASDAHPKLATCLGAARAAGSGDVALATASAAAVPTLPTPPPPPIVTPPVTPTEPLTPVTRIPAEPAGATLTSTEAATGAALTPPTGIPTEPVAPAPGVPTDPGTFAVDASTEVVTPATGIPTQHVTLAADARTEPITAVTATIPAPVGPPPPGPPGTADEGLPLEPPGGAPDTRARTRRIVAIAAALTLVVGGTAAALLLRDEPEGVAGPDGDGETTSTTSTSTSTSTTTTTEPPPTTEDTTDTSGEDGGATPIVTTPPTTTPPTTAPPTTVPTPGSPCNPADGNPDCTDQSFDSTFRIVADYAACLAEDLLPDDMCADLDGDNVAGYPDSG